jgi:hypothetical protein
LQALVNVRIVAPVSLMSSKLCDMHLSLCLSLLSFFSHVCIQALVNVLIVAPDSLLGLVNASLRLSHREALKYISLREDFKAARVEGKSLAQLFSGV